VSSSSFSATYTVTNSGFTFSPSAVTINLGDTVIFSLASIHTAEEVTQATWNANGNSSNGGFFTSLGGGTVVPSHTGTYYYVCSIHYYMGMKGTITVTSATGVPNQLQTIPHELSLTQNYPNPFNPTTTISFSLPQATHVSLTIYNLIGQEAEILVDEDRPTGNYSVVWNSGNLASGVYFYRLQTGTTILTKKLVLMK
jgi:plastocyanin